jgi:hypothetical protein
MISKMSLRGWVVALLSFIACLLLVNRGLFPEAPGNRDKTLKSEESVTPSVLVNPMRDGSRWFPGLKQGRANSKPLSPPSDVRSDSRFSEAIDTFDHIQIAMDKLPSKYKNARVDLHGLKKKLFTDDYRFIAMSLGMDCSGAEAAFNQLNSSAQIHPENPVAEVGPGTKNVQNSIVADRCKALIEESGNPVFSNIAGIFLSRGIEDASQSQLLLDAMSYVTFKTYTEEELQEDIRHSAGIRKRLDAEFGSGGGDEYAKAASETVSELTQVLDAYKSVYQRRMTKHLGAAGDGIMEALGKLKLTGANILEVGVPCN